MTFPFVELSPLPANTVVPEEEKFFIPYLNRLYEDIAFAVNERDNGPFPIVVTSTPVNMTNIPTYGAYLVCIGSSPTIFPAVLGTLPTITVSLCKSSPGIAGQVVVLGSQAGSGAWAGINLTVTSTATNFQVAHNNTGVSGNFNVRIVGSLKG